MRRIGSVGFSLSLLLVLPATSRAQSALEAVSSGFSWWLLESPSPGGFQSISAIVPPLACGGDCDEAAFWIGFGPPPGDTFFYGGVEYDTILMTSNGYAIAGSTADPGFLTPVNQAMPDSTVPNNVLAPFWTDLDLDGLDVGDPGGGEMYAATGNFLGGSTVYTVLEWKDAEVKGNPGAEYSFQIWIELTTDNVWFVYDTLPPVLPASLTVGVEDSLGDAGHTRYFNGAGLEPVGGTDLEVYYGTDLIFLCDFESGDTWGWSAIVP